MPRSLFLEEKQNGGKPHSDKDERRINIGVTHFLGLKVRNNGKCEAHPLAMTSSKYIATFVCWRCQRAIGMIAFLSAIHTFVVKQNL